MDLKAFSPDELHTLSKEMVLTLYGQLLSSYQLIADQNRLLSAQLEQMSGQNEALISQV